MGAESSGYRTRFDQSVRKPMPFGPTFINLTEDEAEALLLDVTALLHEFAEERAQTLFGMVEAEGSDFRIGTQP